MSADNESASAPRRGRPRKSPAGNGPDRKEADVPESTATEAAVAPPPAPAAAPAAAPEAPTAAAPDAPAEAASAGTPAAPAAGDASAAAPAKPGAPAQRPPQQIAYIADLKRMSIHDLHQMAKGLNVEGYSALL